MELAQQIIEGNRTALGQGITLLESTLPEHEQKAQELLFMFTPEREINTCGSNRCTGSW